MDDRKAQPDDFVGYFGANIDDIIGVPKLPMVYSLDNFWKPRIVVLG